MDHVNTLRELGWLLYVCLELSSFSRSSRIKTISSQIVVVVNEKKIATKLYCFEKFPKEINDLMTYKYDSVTDNLKGDFG